MASRKEVFDAHDEYNRALRALALNPLVKMKEFETLASVCKEKGDRFRQLLAEAEAAKR